MAVALMLVGAWLLVTAAAIVSIPLAIATAGALLLVAGVDLARP